MRATDSHAPPLVAAHVLSGQPASGMRSTAGGAGLHIVSAALPGDDTTKPVSGCQSPICAAHVPWSQEACDACLRQAAPYAGLMTWILYQCADIFLLCLKALLREHKETK